MRGDAPQCGARSIRLRPRLRTDCGALCCAWRCGASPCNVISSPPRSRTDCGALRCAARRLAARRLAARRRFISAPAIAPTVMRCASQRCATPGSAPPRSVISSPSPITPTAVRCAVHRGAVQSYAPSFRHFAFAPSHRLWCAVLRLARPCAATRGVVSSSPSLFAPTVVRFALQRAAPHSTAPQRCAASVRLRPRPRTDCGALCCALHRHAVHCHFVSVPAHRTNCGALCCAGRRDAWPRDVISSSSPPCTGCGALCLAWQCAAGLGHFVSVPNRTDCGALRFAGLCVAGPSCAVRCRDT